jgi:CheY-like chemotaxis protein
MLLPECAASAIAEDAAPPRPMAVQASGRLVLLVEDEAEVRKVIRRQLTDLGFLVVEADNGAEAARMVESTPDIALLITDVVMPGTVGGRALAEFVRRQRPDLKVVLMSGYAEGLERAAAAPDLPLLRKPFSKEELAAAIEGTRW